MSSDSQAARRVEARLEAHEQLLRHLIVTVLARSESPIDEFEDFQRRLSAPLRRKPVRDSGEEEAGHAESSILEFVEWMGRTVREDIQRALAQVSARRK